MFINLVIISVILVAIVILTLGVKLWFNPDAEFSAHSCALENGSLDKERACSKCQLKDLVDCLETTENQMERN
jgi:hypothetical protein